MECLSKRARKKHGNYQNEAQDALGTLPGRLKMAPGGTSMLKFMRLVFWSDKSSDHPNDFFASWLIFGTRPGSENRPKSALLPKRHPQRRCQKQFLWLRCFFSLFPSIWSQKWTKNQWKIECVCPVLRVFFPNPRKPNSMHRRSVLSSFYFFNFCDFLQKISKKTSKTGVSQKNTKNEARGRPQTPKI